MAEIEVVDQLKEAVEYMHGGIATLAQSVPVSETFEEQTAWQVYIFDLAGHPTATRAYAWSAPIEGSTKRQFFSVLHIERTYLPVEQPYPPSGVPRNAAMTPELSDDDLRDHRARPLSAVRP
jgi:hypothetical protein